MIVKIHKKDGKTIVAVCDDELLGRKFEENGLQLDLSSDFYKGEKLQPQEVGDIIRNGDIVNLVGTHSVELGIKEGIIEEEQVKKIQGISHAQAIISTEG